MSQTTPSVHWPPVWHSGTVASAGEEIYYEVTGDDALPTVVLSHGAGGSHVVWYRQVATLARRFRVVTWDSRGFGRSTFRSGVLTGAACGADLAAVCDAAGVETAHLVGQSMGGWWTVEAALAHPRRVRSLTLANTIASLYTPALANHFEAMIHSGAPAAGRLGEHPAIHPGLAHSDPATAFLYQELNTLHTPPMLEVAIALFEDRHEPAELEALGVPVLVITGSDDPLFPAPLVRESFERLHGARIAEIAGGGHSPYFERPDEWNEILLGFLCAIEDGPHRSEDGSRALTDPPSADP